MKFRKYLTIVAVFLMAILFVPSMTVYAESDVDFTISVNTDVPYISGDTIACDIIIKNQTDKGYVEMELFLTFDTDALNCLSIFDNVDGFSTKVEEREGQSGLVIKYLSPDGNPSVKGEKVVKLQFAVITGAATGDYPLKLQVVSCFGFDSAGNKEDAVEKGDKVLSLSMAKDKKLALVETPDNAIGNSTGDGSDPNYYYTEPTANQQVDDKKGGATVGTVLLMVFGAVVVFAAGVVVGFILCQKRMNEDGYDRSVEPAPSRRYAGGGLSSLAGRFSKSIYDDNDDEEEDNFYNERISQKYTPSRRPSVLDDDDEVDTSYFGRAAETHLGSGSRNAYDDEFPDEFTPRRYNTPASSAPAQQPEEEYGSYDFLGGHRHERADDGYGAFSENASPAAAPDDFDDDDDDGYFSDRRRYR